VLLEEFPLPRVALKLIATGLQSEMHLARFTLSQLSYSGLQKELEPTSVGTLSTGWGSIAHAPGGLSEIALAWVMGPSGAGWPGFQRVDISTWSPSAAVSLASTGGPVGRLVPGKSISASGTAYAGDGYAVTWRRPSTAGPDEMVIAVLDPYGQVKLGPIVTYPPDRIAGVTWSGSTYLLGSPLQTGGVQLARLRPANGTPGDLGGVELAQLLPSPAGLTVGRVSLRPLGTDVVVAWLEKPTSGSTLSPRVRVARVSSDGNLILDSGPTYPVASTDSAVTLTVDGDCPVVTWVEPGDLTLADNVMGRALVRVVRLAPNLQGPAVWTQSPSTKYYNFGSPWTITRGSPGTLLTTWGARSVSTGLEVIYAARHDCAP